MFNITADIYYTNGTLVSSYVNDTGTGTTWSLKNEYTSSLGCPACGNVTYYINATAQDSHTNTENYIEAYKINEKIKFRNKRNNKYYESGNVQAPVEITLFESSFTEQFDRIKFDYHVKLKKSIKNWELTIPFTSDCPINIIENSTYEGHFVTCEGWVDFEDAHSEGWDVTLLPVDDYNINIVLSQTFRSSRKEVWIDPASGGLNENFATSYFTIIPNAEISSTTTAFTKDTIGYVLLYYNNASDSTLITGADCEGTITDPYANPTSINASELTGFYRAGYTPSFAGTHTYSFACNNIGWTTQTETGSFNVLSALPDYGITLSVDSGTEITKQYCSGNNRVAEMNKTVCLEGSCSDVSYQYEVTCEHGCYQGICNQAPANYIIFVIIGIIALILLLVILGVA